MRTRTEWRKSSYSSQNGACVEVATNLPGAVALVEEPWGSGAPGFSEYATAAYHG